MTSNIEYLECVNFENKQTPKELLDNLVNFFKSTPRQLLHLPFHLMLFQSQQ